MVTYRNGSVTLCIMPAGREHPELTEVLCVELMTRQLDAQSATAIQQHAMLACLAPWMENLSFAARWEGVRPLSRVTARVLWPLLEDLHDDLSACV